MSEHPGRRTGPMLRKLPRSAARALSALAIAGVLLGACGASGGSSAERSSGASTSTSASSGSSTTLIDTTSTSTTAVPSGAGSLSPSVRDRLAVLQIDDRPSPQGDYRREDWPHWADVDGNGCDARQDALTAWSIVAATVNRNGTCKVVAGSWVSPYDLMASNNPSDFDVDHLVPLANAFESGGWRWSAERRRAYANDPGELVVASARSNRSKGSDSPDQWRPDNGDSWCAYADAWVKVKSAWGLSVTTSERDALGQMLDTCTIAGPVWPRGSGAVLVSPEPAPSGSAVGGGSAGSSDSGGSASNGGASGDAYYANCTAARAAGAAPIHSGESGYRSALDRDGDGVACE